MTHPGVGPVTALATEVFLGDPRGLWSANSTDSKRRMGCVPNFYFPFGKEVRIPRGF